MTTHESIAALRRANPRRDRDSARSIRTTVEAVGAHVRAEAGEPLPRETRRLHSKPIGRLSLGAVSLAAAMVALVFVVGRPGSGGGVEDAAAAVRHAAVATAVSAKRSGTAVVRMTRDGELWAGSTVRWNSEDLALRSDTPGRAGKVGGTLLVVDGTMYATDPETGGWAVLGPPESVDPDSGTTPAEYLAAVRRDVGGASLRGITGAMGGLTTEALGDGSTVYRGTVPAGELARESGAKDGERLRVFPSGFVAHGEAADPQSPIDVAVTVGADGLVRQIAARWSEGRTAWTYSVAYDGLGTTPAPAAPKNATPLDRAVDR
jgi:hypothetical protein